jgi:hypothetical protein
MQASSLEFLTENQDDIRTIYLDFGVTNVDYWPNIRTQNFQEPTTRIVSGRINLRPSFGRVFTKRTEKESIFSKVNRSSDRLDTKIIKTFFRHMYRKLLFLSLNCLIKVYKGRTFP